MNDQNDSNELEELLRRHRPAGPDDRVRREILAAVSRELSPPERRSGARRRTIPGPGWLVAASIGLGVALNFWVMGVERARERPLFGQSPTPQPIADVVNAVRSVTDVETAAYFERNLQSAWNRGHRPQLSNSENILKQATASSESKT